MSHFHRKPILVPVDFSTASLQAARVAVSVAEDIEDVTLVHVAHDYELVASPYGWSLDCGRENYWDSAVERLNNWIAENGLTGVESQVVAGDPGTRICDVASQTETRLIVLSSHGRSGIERVLLGSVAERVIRHCECDVLVLRRTDDAQGSRIDENSMTWCPRQCVIVPIDFSDNGITALHVGKELVDGRECIDVINVVPSFEDRIIGSTVVTDEERRLNRQETLERYLAGHEANGMRAHALTGDPGTTICSYADKVNADVVVISSHGYHGLKRLLLGSTAERVVRHCGSPVLILRRNDAE